MRINRKYLFGTMAIFILLSGVIVTWRLLYLDEQGNFHTISPGQAYRSAQLDQDELEYYHRKYGLRSVINLRGKVSGEKWYQEEIATCRKEGLQHYDLSLSPDHEPTQLEVQKLLQIFRTAPRPVLVHCKAGADRAGLAAAVWQLVINGRPKSEARKQLSLIYGHMPLGPTQALDEFFEKWENGKQALNP